MKERPILFSAPMVSTVIDGTKTQTRRVVKPEGADHLFQFRGKEWLHGADEPTGEWAWCGSSHVVNKHIYCPYGKPGDRLWVRETWMDLTGTGIESRDERGKIKRYAYGADTPPGSWGDQCRKDYGLKWRPSIHMPRDACRILLEVTGVRVERLQDISEADAMAEGIEKSGECNWCDYLDYGYNDFTSARHSYRSLWESINGAGSWGANPWVWVIEFKRVDVGAMKQAA